ncbi:MAG TPA: hypothetical protein VM869_00480 [Enhygromyxa sp.]|jgi:hypothetical protein|nr:hypothetical protein [Enhygromyxa sp.]
MPLTEAERISAMRHLGYTVLSTPTSLSLGFPGITQANFVAEQNLLNLTAAGEKLVREQLERLDCLQRKLDQVALGSDVDSAGGVRFRPSESIENIERVYNRYQLQLADMIGATISPLSQKDPPRGVVEPC